MSVQEIYYHLRGDAGEPPNFSNPNPGFWMWLEKGTETWTVAWIVAHDTQWIRDLAQKRFKEQEDWAKHWPFVL